MTRRNKRIVGTVGLFFMSAIAAVIGIAIGGALMVAIAKLYVNS